MHEFTTRRRVEFSDTDMSGIAHFARFLVFMESTEHEFLARLGGSAGVSTASNGVLLGWPRVAARCEYLAPARFGDILEIHLKVLHKGRTSLTHGFTIRCGEILVARGQVTAVHCVLNEPGGLRPVPIPERLASRIEEAPAE